MPAKVCTLSGLYSGSESAAPLAEDDNCEPETLYVDQRFSHTQQLMARLDFVR